MNISCEPRSIRILSSNGNRLAQQKGVDDKGNTKYYDIAFPLTAELRTAISEAVIGAYKERLKELQTNAAHDDTQSEANTSAEDYEEDDVNERF